MQAAQGERKMVLVVGAGPIGLEAAVSLVKCGFAVTIVEKGTSVASNVRSWGHVRLFSNNTLNLSRWGRTALVDMGQQVPNDDDHPSGAELCACYLDTLARWLEESPHAAVRLRTSVVALSRGELLKGEQVKAVGETARNNAPFAALIGSAQQVMPSN